MLAIRLVLRIALVVVVAVTAVGARAVAGPAPAPAPATPRPRVLVLDTAETPQPGGFVDALRIHLAGVGDVERGPTLPASTTATRVVTAARLGRERGATLVVWVERAPMGDDLVLFVVFVSGGAGTATVEAFRLPSPGTGDEADTDRALALKVGGVLDRRLAGLPAAAPEVLWLAPLAPPAAPATQGQGGDGPPPPPPPASRPWLLEARLGGTPDAIGSVQGWLGLGFGRRWGWGDVVAGAEVTTSAAKRERGRRVEARDLRLAAELRVRRWLGRVPAELALVGGARVVAARGDAPPDIVGSDTVVVPFVGAALGARARLAPRLELHATVGVELALRRVTLQVDVVDVADLGRWRGTATISLVVLIP